ncbi:sarcosine oxidase subunit delta [Arthrobacter sp. ISL-30]|uniref:sarcosine oxidase subunit delta n=1 Tax=Arthrobacter sp. ISL-30 TaxID=2819109 RepID=UPI001BE9A85C|nr:sarcosine oxidase subunit delta [Arthrobacter sp. ISL-30]MBT2513005.1 sarcosine oxidase subunit delta [Arthrobacter sp. ISL-30]
MIQIQCPNCGPRDETEFHYGGQAHVAYPENPDALSDEEWARYLFYRENTKGQFAERWSHSGGCRKWFNAIRDTVTYRFSAVYPAGSPRPDNAPAQPDSNDPIVGGTK